MLRLAWFCEPDSSSIPIAMQEFSDAKIRFNLLSKPQPIADRDMEVDWIYNLPDPALNARLSRFDLNIYVIEKIHPDSLLLVYPYVWPGLLWLRSLDNLELCLPLFQSFSWCMIDQVLKSLSHQLPVPHLFVREEASWQSILQFSCYEVVRYQLLFNLKQSVHHSAIDSAHLNRWIDSLPPSKIPD